jgi:hypothetical protein
MDIVGLVSRKRSGPVVTGPTFEGAAQVIGEGHNVPPESGCMGHGNPGQEAGGWKGTDSVPVQIPVARPQK